MKLSAILATLIIATLSSCVTAPEPKVPFNAEDAAFIHKIGNNTIAGQAFLRRNDGVVVYAAGSNVYLIPKTPYSTERLDAIYQGGKMDTYVKPPPSPPGYEEAIRRTKADGEGRFSFDHVATGSYFITTSVVWMAGYSPQGGSIRETVTVSGGQSVNVIMSGQ